MAEHLTEPFFTPTPEGYRVSWCQGEEWVYEARVTNLHQNGNSAIWGELSFECRDNDIPKLHGLAFNLLSTRGRTDIAKHLELLHVIPALNWTELVEQVCAGVVNLFRRGEPVEELWTSGEAKRPEYYL